MFNFNFNFNCFEISLTKEAEVRDTWFKQYLLIKDYFGLKCILSYVLFRPGSDNSISLCCKMRHTIDISNYRLG